MSHNSGLYVAPFVPEKKKGPYDVIVHDNYKQVPLESKETWPNALYAGLPKWFHQVQHTSVLKDLCI